MITNDFVSSKTARKSFVPSFSRTCFVIGILISPLVAIAQKEGNYLTADRFVRAKVLASQDELRRKAIDVLKVEYSNWTLPHNSHPVDWEKARFSIVPSGKPVLSFRSPEREVLGLSTVPVTAGYFTPAFNCDPKPITLNLDNSNKVVATDSKETKTSSQRVDTIRVKASSGIGKTGSIEGEFTRAMTTYEETTIKKSLEATNERKTNFPLELPARAMRLYEEKEVTRIERIRHTSEALIDVKLSARVLAVAKGTWLRAANVRGNLKFKAPDNIYVLLDVGNWSRYADESLRSMPVHAELTAEYPSSFKFIKRVDFTNEKECERAFKAWQDSGYDPKTLPTANPENTREGSASPVMKGNPPRQPVLSAKKEFALLEVPMSNATSLATAATNRSCTASVDGRAGLLASDISAEFEISNLNGCGAKPSSTGTVRFGLRIINEKGKEEVLKNYTSRWSGRHGQSFRYSEVFRFPPGVVKAVKEMIDKDLVECTCTN